MVFAPYITWNENVVTAPVWVDGKKEQTYTLVYDCKSKKVIKNINPSSVEFTDKQLVIDHIQEEFDKGIKIDHIDATVAIDGKLWISPE